MNPNNKFKFGEIILCPLTKKVKEINGYIPDGRNNFEYIELSSYYKYIDEVYSIIEQTEDNLLKIKEILRKLR